MIKLTLFWITSVFLTCNNLPAQDSQDSKESLSSKSPQNIVIKTITVKDAEFKNICFGIWQSTYPEVIGLDDRNFEKQLNDIFSSNFHSFADSSKKTSRCDDTYVGVDHPNTISAEFEILTNKDSIVSISQIMTFYPGHGANYDIPTIYVTTADVKNRIIYGKQEFGINSKSIKYLNTKIKEYFDKKFVEEALLNAIKYPIIANSEDLKKVNIGVRNDSVIMIILAQPTSRASGRIYSIPLKEFLPTKTKY